MIRKSLYCGVLYCRFLPAVDSSKQQQSLQRWMWMCVGLNQGELGWHCHREPHRTNTIAKHGYWDDISLHRIQLTTANKRDNQPSVRSGTLLLFLFYEMSTGGTKPSIQLSLASRSFYKSFTGCARKHLVRTMKTLHFLYFLSKFMTSAWAIAYFRRIELMVCSWNVSFAWWNGWWTSRGFANVDFNSYTT